MMIFHRIKLIFYYTYSEILKTFIFNINYQIVYQGELKSLNETNKVFKDFYLVSNITTRPIDVISF
jgi:hypothetical protein